MRVSVNNMKKSATLRIDADKYNDIRMTKYRLPRDITLVQSEFPRDIEISPT